MNYSKFRQKDNYIGKTAPIYLEIEAVLKHTNKIEVQLIERITPLEKADLFKRNDLDIISVHAPLIHGVDNNVMMNYDTVYIEQLTHEATYETFINTCDFAKELSDYFGHEIIVVLHNGWFESNWIVTNHKDDIAKIFKNIVIKYPNLKFAIENVSIFTSGYRPKDAVYIAKYLNENVANKKFGVVIDTCHIMCTENAKKVLDISDGTNYSFNDWFRINFEENNNKEIVLIVHYCNIKNNGFSSKDHGTAFTESEDDVQKMKELQKAILTYAPNSNIVVEVRENDYQAYDNLKTTIASSVKVANTTE